MSLLRLPLNPSDANPGQLLLTKSSNTPVSLDVDCLEGFIYWSDVTMRTIRRTPYNGSFSEILLSSAGSPEGISIDWVSRDIYWIDTTRDVINVARLDAITRTKAVISDGLFDPRDVAVHPGLGKIYWSDWHRTSPSIQFRFV
jgi:nidogen (entactin)